MKFYLAYLVTNNNELYSLNLEAFQIRKSSFLRTYFKFQNNYMYLKHQNVYLYQAFIFKKFYLLTMKIKIVF